MDLDRIERALRDGPPDEPRYVPGSFRRRRGRAWTTGLAVSAVAVALLAVVLGAVGVTSIRDGGVGGREPGPDAVRAALPGTTWDTAQIPIAAWTAALLERGFTSGDLAAFLEHDPFGATVRYRLVFGQEVLTVQAAYDGAAPVTLGRGAYEIQDDGTLDYAELVPGTQLADACAVTARLAVGEHDLDLHVLDQVQCGPEERLANLAFFDLAPYVRANR